MKALPDVNVLIALLDEDHPHHDTAANWFVLNSELGWATCPLTQNGCIRILSQTLYPNSLSIGEVVEGLRAVTLIKSHEFIADDVSLLNQGVVDVSSISSHRQLTDIYQAVRLLAAKWCAEPSVHGGKKRPPQRNPHNLTTSPFSPW